MADQKHRRSLTVQAFWLLLARTLAFIFAFALPILLTRTLSQNEYGLFKQVFLIVTTATALLPLGFGLSAYYYLPRQSDARHRGQVILNILLFNLIMGAVACLVLVLWPGVLATIFKDPSIQAHAPLIGAVILLWLFSSFLETVTVANQELKLATLFIVGGQLVRTISLLGAAIVFDTVTALIYAALIHGVLQSMALIWYVRSRFGELWQTFDWSLTYKQISYALPFGLAGLLYTIQIDMHNYFVSSRFGAATFAVYSIGVAQLPFVGILRDSVNSVILPRINSLQEQNQPREIVTLLANATRKLAAVFLPIYAFLLVTGPEFLTVMFTSAYAKSWPIFAINLTLLPLSLLDVDAVSRAYEGHRFYLVKLQVVLSVVNFFALWYAISRFGLVGAISVVVAVNFILRGLLLVRFSQVLGMKLTDLWLLLNVAKVALAAAVAGLFSLFVRSMIVGGATSLMVMSVCFLVFAAIYLPAIMLLRVPTPDEREKVRGSISRLHQFAQLRRSADFTS